MGTLRATLSLASSDVLSSPIALNVSAAVSADSGLLSRAKVAQVAVNAAALKVYKADDKVTSAYLYVKNLEREKYVYLYNDANDDVFAKLAGGEFCFVPVAPDQDIKAYATRVDTLVEYGVFGLDSSAVTLS